jgi:hypothetical protein
MLIHAIRRFIWIGSVVVLATAGPVYPQEIAGGSVDVKQILLQASQSAASIQDERTKNTALYFVSSVQAFLGDAAAAHRTAAVIAKPSSREWIISNIGIEQVLTCDFVEARKTLAMIQDKDDLLESFARVYAQRGDLKSAFEAAGAIQNHEKKAKALSSSIRAQIQAGDAQGALLATAGIADERIRAAVAQSIAHTYAKITDGAGLLPIASSIKDKIERARALMAIVEAQAEAGDVQGALKTVSSISPGSFRNRAFRAIATAQAKAGDWAEALKSIETMTPEHPDAFRFGSIGWFVEELVKARGLTAAREIVLTMPTNKSLALHAWHRFMKAQAEAGDIKGALEIASGSNWALGEIAEAQAARGDVKGALETISAITEESDKLSPLFSVAEAQAAQGDVKGALQTASLFPEEKAGSGVWRTRTAVLGKIALAQAKAGDVEGALQTTLSADGEVDGLNVGMVMNEAQANARSVDGKRWIQAVSRIKKAYDRDLALRDIARAQAKAGNADAALSWASELKSPEEKAFALLGVVKGTLTKKACVAAP